MLMMMMTGTTDYGCKVKTIALMTLWVRWAKKRFIWACISQSWIKW